MIEELEPKYMYDAENRAVVLYDLEGWKLMDKSYIGVLYDEFRQQAGYIAGGEFFVMCQKCNRYTRYYDLGKYGHNCPQTKGI